MPRGWECPPTAPHRRSLLRTSPTLVNVVFLLIITPVICHIMHQFSASQNVSAGYREVGAEVERLLGRRSDHHGFQARADLAGNTIKRAESTPSEHQRRIADVPRKSSQGRALKASTSGDQPPNNVGLMDTEPKLQQASNAQNVIEPHGKGRDSDISGGSYITSGAAAGPQKLLTSASTACFGTPTRTDFAIASRKRNLDFHRHFWGVPNCDYLVDDYSCALQKDILTHGRLYVSQRNISFSSNILGWVTTLVIQFDELESIAKKSTALIFRNALMISTVHGNYTFASFSNRDTTYDLIVDIWKLGRLSLKSTMNGVRVEGSGGDKTERVGGVEAPGVEKESSPVPFDSGDVSAEYSNEGVIPDEEVDEEEDEEGRVKSGTKFSGMGSHVQRPARRNVSPMPNIAFMGALLLALLVAIGVRFLCAPSKAVLLYERSMGPFSPHHPAACDGMGRLTGGELLAWLHERIELGQSDSNNLVPLERYPWRQPMGVKVQETETDVRNLEEVIRVMEAKLSALMEMVGKRQWGEGRPGRP
ncbi:hypothetical protein Purlil1_12175 [Purpureocillium lilacinum]|uniref:GRAM domain-containing protein n=1 Tax=Purpureocillium lilacinum TaxID=33203 RepID=A0ABR0BHK0_PURLI|nr:hypothetical protein Purlil1_12175 [Purpureocillium lilacinum]